MIDYDGYDGYNDSSPNPNKDRAVKWLVMVATMTWHVGGKKVLIFFMERLLYTYFYI